MKVENTNQCDTCGHLKTAINPNIINANHWSNQMNSQYLQIHMKTSSEDQECRYKLSWQSIRDISGLNVKLRVWKVNPVQKSVPVWLYRSLCDKDLSSRSYWLALQHMVCDRLRGGTSLSGWPITTEPVSAEQTGLWFQTEGEKRCCSTGSMRQIESFMNIKAWRHVETLKK